MSDLIGVVREWIKDREMNPDALKVSESGHEAHFSYGSSGEVESYEAFLDIDEGKQWAELFLYIPNKVPVKRRRLVAELLALINPDIHLGNFDLFMPDGRVRFRCGMDLEGGAFGVKMIDNMDGMSCRYLDLFYPAIMAVAYAGQTPEHALANLSGEENIDKPKPEWLDEEGEPPAWDHFPGTRCLQRWAAEIRAALAGEASEEDWEMIGHGAILSSENLDRAKAMLRRVAADAGLRFAAIPAKGVPDLPLGVADPFRSIAPALVYLEAGGWMQSPKEDGETTDEARANERFRERLIEKLKAFDPQRPVIHAIAAYKIEDLADQLRTVGVFERRFAVPAPPMEFIGNEFIDSIGRECCGDSLTGAPGKVGRLVSGHESDRARGLASFAMRRLAKRERRKVEFIDLVNFATRGTVESDEPPLNGESVRRQVAYHEAGHALVAIVDSAGRNIPEYSTIVASSGFEGVVVESYSYHHTRGEQSTYRDFLHNVRICLAGRASEQVLVGPENVSTGAGFDLESATRQCAAMFANCGFAPGMDDASKAGSNLALIVGPPSPSECEHIETLTRQFLADEYGKVLEMLNAHRPMLDAIADRLMWDPIVDQAELADLCRKHSGNRIHLPEETPRQSPVA